MKIKQKKISGFDAFNIAIMVILMLIMLFPIFKVIVDSLDTASSYEFALFPKQPSMAAYKVIVTNKALLNPFLISILVTVVGTAVAMFVSTLAAYTLIHEDLPGRKYLMYFMLITMLFNGGLIPTYLVMKQLKLLNTLLAVILPLAINTYNIILLKNFFDGIPKSIQESAEIDGCTPLATFIRVILPMSKPGIAAVSLFYVVTYWNNFFNFVMYISNPKFYNFQVKLREMVLTDETIATDVVVNGKGLQNAAVIVVMIPVMILYPFLQKHFVKGINLGGVKG